MLERHLLQVNSLVIVLKISHSSNKLQNNVFNAQCQINITVMILKDVNNVTKILNLTFKANNVLNQLTFSIQTSDLIQITIVADNLTKMELRITVLQINHFSMDITAFLVKNLNISISSKTNVKDVLIMRRLVL